jgi:putative peptidoglycan lipid II flippase
VTLPVVSRQSARADHRALSATVGQALEMVALLCLPAAAGLALFGVPVIGLVYEHGRFTPRTRPPRRRRLPAMPSALPATPASRCSPRRSTRWATRACRAREPALDRRQLRAQLDLRAGFGFGHVGLALATSAVAVANFAILYVVLRRRLGPLGERQLERSGGSCSAGAS